MRDVLPAHSIVGRIRWSVPILAVTSAVGVLAAASPVWARSAPATTPHIQTVANVRSHGYYTAPAPELVAGASNTALDGATVTVGEALSIANLRSNANVSYYLDGSSSAIDRSNVSPYTWDLQASAGRHSLTATVRSRYGSRSNTSLTASFVVTGGARPTPTPTQSTSPRPTPSASVTPPVTPTPTPTHSTAPTHSASPTSPAPSHTPTTSPTTAPPTTAPPTTAPPSASPTTPVTASARLFAPTSLWNTAKTGLVYSSSADSLLRSSSYGINDGAYDHPMYFAKSTDPSTTFHVGAGWGFPAATITAPAPAGMRPATGGDQVMSVLLTNGQLLDLYGVTGSGTNFTAAYYGTSDGVNGTGFGNQSTYAAVGTTAIGSPQAAGTILGRDVTAGVISHALDMAWDYSDLGGAGNGAGDAVAPAVANDDGGGPGPLPEGGLLFIPAGTPKPAGLSRMGSALWDAASTYGVYITDQLGGSPMFYGDGTVASAFSSSDFTTVGQALRLADNW